MTRTYRIVLPLLGVWLAAWMFLSWAAIQDDALIHLRYADNLFLHHFITYDGVHPDYGASSLLYVGMLALLRGLTASPSLPRALSSVAHGLLFCGLGFAFAFRLPKEARLARLTGLVLLILLVTPSAVRWLDDGMETGIVVSVVSLLAWVLHNRAIGVQGISKASAGRQLFLGVLAFFAVLLRTELALVCGLGFLLLALGRMDRRDSSSSMRILVQGFPLLIGAALAITYIVATMHVPLPDTAIAKSHGLSHWLNPLHDAAITLGGAFSFGFGVLVFWLLTVLLVLLQRRRLSLINILANVLFPIVLLLASLRGQEIQGVRYFAWTFIFPIVWNTLELARPRKADSFASQAGERGSLIPIAFLAVLAVAMPFESRAMYRVLTRRADTMHIFESQHLDVLRTRRGVASDIGYIGYFSSAQLCDLAGLVNGRAAARLTSAQRNLSCVRTDPDFLFVNLSQLEPLNQLADLSGWQVCGRYDFNNVRTLDSHYLLVRPSIAEDVCRATGNHRSPLALLLATSH